MSYHLSSPCRTCGHPLADHQCNEGQCRCGCAGWESAARHERAVLKERISDAVEALDQLADLMADSEDLRVRETPVVRRLNEIIEVLTPPADLPPAPAAR